MNERTFLASEVHKLESSERLSWLPPAEIVAALNLRNAMTVADIGAGTGFFSIPIAKEVGTSGKVIAVDTQQEMLNLLSEKLHNLDSPLNIELIKGKASNTTLTEHSVDVVFMANVWHELDDHALVLKEVQRILRPDGRLVILDWRTDVAQPPGPPLHHRIAFEAVAVLLRRHRWTPLPVMHVGLYSYIVQSMSTE